MRTLIVTENITVDGVIDLTLDNWFAPTPDAGADLADLIDAQSAHRAAADALLTCAGVHSRS
jgi:hypothetical protein